MWRERGRFSPQKDQTGWKRQTKSNRAVGPQNDSEGEKRPAMERERSCCRGENVIKYPSSWENALASAGLGNGFIPVLPQGGRNRVYRYSRAGEHPRVTSLGLCPIYLLQGHPHPPQCAHWGTFPLEGGRLGGRLIAAPTAPFEPFGTDGSGTCAEGGDLPPHPPRIRSAPSPQGEGFRATARVAPTAYPAPVPLVR